LTRLHSLAALGLAAVGFAACGPDAKPGPPCDGPTYDLVVKVEDGPLPPDLRLNVRYGGNHEGESYALGKKHTPQAVFCSEEASEGALRCRLYTQGPARIDVTATGYEPIEEQDLTLARGERCRVEKTVELKLLMDAGT
jgi:hypothetical protein